MSYSSRGSLSEIKNGQNTSEDETWLKVVKASFMTLEDAVNFDGYLEPLNLWGVYENDCPHVRREFNEEYFYPRR